MIYDVYLYIKKSGCKGGWDAKPLHLRFGNPHCIRGTQKRLTQAFAKLHAWNQMCQVGAAQVQAWIGIALNEPHSEVRVHLSTWRYREGLPSTSSSRQIPWYEYENWWAGKTLLYPTKKKYCVEHSYRYLLHVCASPQHTALHDIARCRAAEVLPSGNQTWQWKSHANPSFTDDFPSNSNPVYIQVGLWIAMFDYHQRNYIYINIYIYIYIYVCVPLLHGANHIQKKRMAGFAPEIHIRRSDLPLSFGDTTQCLG